MKWSLYGTRNSITTLRDEAEVKRMLQYVIDQEELFEDKEREAMFGRFVKKPHLLSIPPGLYADFKYFLKAVDDLIKPPKKKITTSKRETPQKDEVLSKKQKRKPTAEDVTNLARKYILKEAHSAFKNGLTKIRLTEEMIDNAFTIAPSGHNYKFQCNKVGCKKVTAIPYDSQSNNAILSNQYRHLKLCLLGIDRKGKDTGVTDVKCKPEKPLNFTKPSADFFAKNRNKSSSSISKEVTIIAEEIEFALTTTSSVSDSLLTLTPIAPAMASTPEITASKNLQLPAALPDLKDVSGH